MHRYHTTSGMKGYIPNTVTPFTSLTAARAYARDEAEQYREADFEVRGSMVRGYEFGHAGASKPQSMSGFFGYIAVEDCQWADCEVELDG